MRWNWRHSTFAAMAVVAFTTAFVPSEARGQVSAGGGRSGGYAPSWGGYNPGYVWGGYAPGGWYAYTPGTPVPPAATVSPWTGYVPPTVGTRYAPATAWGGYAPGSVVIRQPVGPVSRRRGPDFRPSTYREFGSGRNVFMHKPWLPNTP